MEREALMREARRRRRRRYLAAGTAIIAIVAGAVVVSTGAGPGSHPQPPGRHATAAANPVPSTMSGLPMPPANSVRLLLTGPRPAGFSMATRQTERIAGLP